MKRIRILFLISAVAVTMVFQNCGGPQDSVSNGNGLPYEGLVTDGTSDRTPGAETPTSDDNNASGEATASEPFVASYSCTKTGSDFFTNIKLGHAGGIAQIRINLLNGTILTGNWNEFSNIQNITADLPENYRLVQIIRADDFTSSFEITAKVEDEDTGEIISEVLICE